jgi:iron complex outermembrane receptor protein
MKTSSEQQRQKLSAGRTQMELWSLTATAGAVALLMASTGAAAQEAAPAAQGQTETIVVTGIRKGIEDAISVKKNQDGVAEAISAEDIGKLPDTTIAESLARLPGVTTQRDRSGNATNISIRGLGPDFNGYLLNGREQTSTGDSRAVDLSVYPAELIAGATVYKTSDSSLAAAGLAGTIDTKLIDPLAFPGRRVAAFVEKQRTGEGLPVTGDAKRYGLSYIDQFADRKLGFAVGWVHADGDKSQFNSGPWGGGDHNYFLPGNSTATPDGKASIPTWGNGLDYTTEKDTDKRDGVAAILNYKPNKAFNSELDLYWGKIKTNNHQARIQGGLGGLDVHNATVSGGNITAGTFNLGGNPNGIIDRTEAIFDNDEIQSVGWRNTLKINDAWTGSVDLNHNKATRVERDIEAYAGNPNPDTLSFTTDGSGIPHLTVGSPTSYTDPNVIVVRDQTGWSGINGVPQAGYDKGPTITDKLDALRLDLTHDLGDNGWFSDVKFGLNYSKRSKDRVTDEGLIVSTTNNGHDPIPFPAGAYVVNNVGDTGLNMLSFDPSADLWPGATLLRKYNDDILSKTWYVQEKITTAYGKLDIDTQMAGVPVRGNVGVQVIHTDQSSRGFRAAASSDVTLTNPAGGLSTDGTTYTDVLPSLNLTGDLGHGNLIRFGLGEQIARPDMTLLRNSYAVSINQQCKFLDANGNQIGTGPCLTASGGDPSLKPFKGKALDLSYEKYFGNKGYVSIAGFYKKLDTYIVTTNDVVDLTSGASSVGLNPPPGTTLVGPYVHPVNGHGGSISGVELTASVPFELLWKPLQGFGAVVSYSSTSSDIALPNLIGQNPTQAPNAGTISLPGLSKDNAKLMLYYERGGFSAFIADNYRSTYVGSVSGAAIGGYPTLTYIKGSSWVSAQVGYEFQEGRLKGLSLRLEGTNLNKPTYTEMDANNNTTFTTKTGSAIDLKLSYKL